MELKVLEKKGDKLKLQVTGESHTFLNLLSEYAWLAKAKQASYMIKHPYLSEPELIVRSANPKKTLHDANQIIMDRAQEFQRGFKRALRK
ncbi:MAG: DNA-directed RNA polymerase subunit L [Candidatus Aenigmarchaeota archaeon]|nr:DNA-directed RNA polymerase subunit L [Candidatus Aenigmarchaeota archaeon]